MGIRKESNGLWYLSVFCSISLVIGFAWSRSKVTLHNFLPVRVQHHIRDSGWGRAIADGAVILSLPSIVLVQPSVLLLFVRARMHVRRYRYGEGHKEFLEVFSRLSHSPGRGGGDIETSIKSSSNNNINNYSNNNSPIMSKNSSGRTKQNHNVLVFVHGGAWGSGLPWMYRLVALGISKCINASTAILIEYPVFPDSFILDQADW